MSLILQELADWCGGRLTVDTPKDPVAGISIDSRTVKAGEAFLALPGDQFDGHEFIADAIAGGAAVAIVSDESKLAGLPGIVVPDTLMALGDIAHRNRWHAPLIPWVAITGTNGKTTTREMLARILRRRGPVVSSPRNFNNLIGLPLTILQRAEHDWVGVVEMGASKPGEIARLSDITTPTISIVTMTGAAHLAGFQSLDAVAQEKAAIYSRLPHDGVAIYPAQDPRTHILQGTIPGNRASFAVEAPADLMAEQVRVTADGTEFLVRGILFKIPLYGRHIAHNCLAALLAAEHLGIPLEECAESLAGMPAVAQRMEPIRTKYLTIFNDVYNANPSSLRAATDVLCELEASRRVVIVGDMLDLGGQTRTLHRECGRALAGKGLDMILAVGKHAVGLAEVAGATNARVVVRHFSNVQKLLLNLKKILRPDDAILVKGSRGMRMERVTESLRKWKPPAIA